MSQSIAVSLQMPVLLEDLALLDKRVVARQLLHQSGGVGILGLQALGAIRILGFDAVHFGLISVDLDYKLGVQEAVTRVTLTPTVATTAVLGLGAVGGLGWVVLVVVAFVAMGEGEGGEEEGEENGELHRER